jgi:hypothetical protein
MRVRERSPPSVAVDVAMDVVGGRPDAGRAGPTREGHLVPPPRGTWRARLGRASCSTPYPRIHPQCVHTMLMSPPRACSYGVIPWGKRQFMIRCVASGSTLMFRPVGLTRNGPMTTANTACFPTHRFRRRCSRYRVPEMTLPRTTTVGCGHILRVCQQPTGNGRPRCGDREQPFPQKPTRGKRRDTPPAVPRRPEPAATPRIGTRRQVTAVLTPRREVECDR